MCGPKFCSMKISHDIRDEAARVAGLVAQREAFKAAGGQVYVPAADAAE
jgi:phosphomethylpyrimidine synthase